MALVPCPHCNRHVRCTDAEESCPFCGHALPADLKSRAAPGTTRRLDRWATFTFVAALAVAGTTGVGCSGGSESDESQSETDDELRKKKDGGKDAAKRDSGCREVDEDRGGMFAAYGLPPARRDFDDRPPCGSDAGAPDSEDDDVVVDAGRRRDGGGIVPAYGLPPQR